jgi:hypothetical protein
VIHGKMPDRHPHLPTAEARQSKLPHKFPVFPVEPGISSIFPVEAPFGCENGEAHQAFAAEFPQQAEPGIRTP